MIPDYLHKYLPEVRSLLAQALATGTLNPVLTNEVASFLVTGGTCRDTVNACGAGGGVNAYISAILWKLEHSVIDPHDREDHLRETMDLLNRHLLRSHLHRYDP